MVFHHVGRLKHQSQGQASDEVHEQPTGHDLTYAQATKGQWEPQNDGEIQDFRQNDAEHQVVVRLAHAIKKPRFPVTV